MAPTPHRLLRAIHIGYCNLRNNTSLVAMARPLSCWTGAKRLCSTRNKLVMMSPSTIPSSSSTRASSRDPPRSPGVVSDTHGITKLHSALSAMLITLFLLSRLSQCTTTEMIPTIISMVGIISVAVQPNAPLSLHPVAADRGEI